MDKYQTIGSRFGALIIDSLVLIPISIASQLLAVFFSNNQNFIYATQFFTTFLTTAYYVIMHARNGQTLGKLACKVKVVNLEEEDITLQQSIIRSLPQIIQLLMLALVPAIMKSPDNQINQFFLLYGVGFYGVFLIVWSLADIIVAFSSEKHRALHDFIAGTIVVKI